MIKRSYIDGSHGQIHIHQWGENTDQAPLICLSPSPFSGEAYVTLAPLLANDREVIAVDYPGYGNSDPAPHAPMIADYAQAISEVIDSVSPNQAANLVGFHTGCLVAAETSLINSEQVNQLILVDVPFFSPEKQTELLPTMGKLVELTPELDMLAETWGFCVGKRLEHIPLPRAYDMFVDHISAGVNTNAAFNAAFQYPCEKRFKLMTHDTTVIATKAGLYETSCATADVIPNAKLIEHTEITVAVLEKGAPTIANEINSILS